MEREAVDAGGATKTTLAASPSSLQVDSACSIDFKTAAWYCRNSVGEKLDFSN
jgi:hypothetical protein